MSLLFTDPTQASRLKLRTMVDPSVGKQDDDISAIQHDIENRRSSVASINLNKNVDAEYVLNIRLLDPC